MSDSILTNARLILQDGVRDGTLVMRDGHIHDISSHGKYGTGTTDCDGDYVMPGLVELHTDNLERHLQPRPRVDWPHDAAILAHDAELASTGITTVFDALRVGSITAAETDYGEYARALATRTMVLQQAG